MMSICLKLNSNSYFRWELAGEYMSMLKYNQVANMNRVNERRNHFRQEIRKEEVEKKRAEIRNLMLFLNSHQRTECLLCTQTWISIEPEKQKIISLMIKVLNEYQICKVHSELVFSKILEIIFDYPQYLHQFFSLSRQQNNNLFIRKIILLYQIIDNELLLKNSDLQNELIAICSLKDQFIHYLFDFAFMFRTSFESNSTKLVHQKATNNLKWTSFSIILFVFGKYPLLFQYLLEEYTLDGMAKIANEDQLTQLYSCFGRIYQQSLSNPLRYQKIIALVQQTLINQIKGIKFLPHKIVQFKELPLLLEYILQLNLPVNIELIKQTIIILIHNNSLTSFNNITSSIIKRFKLTFDSKEQEYVQIDLNRLVEKRNEKYIKMDIEIQ